MTQRTPTWKASLLLLALGAATAACESKITSETAPVRSPSAPSEPGPATPMPDGGVTFQTIPAPEMPGDLSVALPALQGVEDYTVVASSSADCASPVATYAATGGQTIALTGLPDGDYYLCVFGRLEGGEIVTAANSATKVTIDRNPPAAFALLPGATLVNAPQIEVAWEPSDGARYVASLGAKAGCSTPEQQAELGPTATSHTFTDVAEGVHFVCVYAYDLIGNATAASGNDRKIEVDLTPSVAFHMTAPAAVETAADVELVWTKPYDAVAFDAAVARDASCADVVKRMTRADATSFLASSLPEGSYHACVWALDTAGNVRAADDQGRAFVVSYPPTATLTGAPSGIDDATALDVVVGGAGVATYRAKLGAVATTDCADGADYGAPQAVATHVTDLLAPVADGPARLCVVGIKADGVGQPFSAATEATWTIDRGSPYVALALPPIAGPGLASGGMLPLAVTAYDAWSAITDVKIAVTRADATPGCLTDAASGTFAGGSCTVELAPTLLTLPGATLDVATAGLTDRAYYDVAGFATDALGHRPLAPAARSFYWHAHVKQARVETSATTTYARYEAFSTVAVDPTNGDVYLGETGSARAGASGLVRKFTPAGVEIVSGWDKVLRATDDITSIAVAPTREVYVAATSAGRWRLFKFQYDGTEDTSGWDKTIDYNATYIEKVRKIAVDPAGDVWALGYRLGVGTSVDWWIKKFSPAGVELWDKGFDNGRALNGDYAWDVAFDTTGAAYVVGTGSDASAASYSWWMKKLDPATGNDLAGWDKTLDWGWNDTATSVVVTPGNDVVVAGYRIATVDGVNRVVGTLRRYATDGTADASFAPDLVLGTRDFFLMDLVAGPSGDFYAVGYAENVVSATSKNDIVVRRVTSTGTVDPAFALSFDARGGNDVANAAVIRGSSLYVVGSGTNVASPTSGVDAWAKKIDLSTGAEDVQRWNKHVAGVTPNSSERFVAVARKSSTGDRYVAGCLSDATWIVRKLQSDGTEVLSGWPRTYAAKGCPRAIVVDQTDGSVYVGGYGTNLVGVGTDRDWLIVKYQADGTQVLMGWPKVYDGGTTDQGIGVYAMAIDAAQSLFVVGEGFGLVASTSMADWWIKKISAAGVEDAAAWNKKINSGTFGYDIATAVAIDGNGDVYVGGRGYQLIGFLSSYDFWLKRFSSAGVEDTGFEKKEDLGYFANVASLQFVGADVIAVGTGNAIVSGTSLNDWVLRGYDKTSGAADAAWTRTIDASSEVATAAAADAGGNVYVVGYASNLRDGGSCDDWFVRKFAATGTEDLAWNHGIDSHHGCSDHAWGVVAEGTGRVTVVGSMTDARGVEDAASGEDGVLATFDEN